MPRLSEGKWETIVALREAGFSWKKIAVQLKVNRSTAQAVVSRHSLRGIVANKHACGRPPKVTEQALCIIKRHVQNNRLLSTAQLTAWYNNGRPSNDWLSRMTMRRTLYKSGFHCR
jgi:transposase